MADSLQKPTDLEKPFEPTKTMVKWLETAFELGYTASISSVAEKAQLDRTQWYSWRNNSEFVDWWDKQWQQHLKLNRWKLDAIGMKRAENNYDYWQSMMERTGLLSSKGPQVAVQNNFGMGVEFTSDDNS